MKGLSIITAVTLVLTAFAFPARAGIQEATGRVTLLRVHDVGTRYGPPTDQIDVEVVIWLDSQPGKAFGFQLRSDAYYAAHQAMLDLLRDAFNNNWAVTIDYNEVPGRRNSVLFRVWLTK